MYPILANVFRQTIAILWTITIYIYTLSKHIYIYVGIDWYYPSTPNPDINTSMAPFVKFQHHRTTWPCFAAGAMTSIFPGTFTARTPGTPSFRASVKTSTATSGALEAGGTVKSGRLLRYPSGNLVGGFKHFLFSIIYGLSSFPLTHIFQRGRYTTNQ